MRGVAIGMLLGVLGVTGCRDAGEKTKKDVVVAEQCTAYLKKAEACSEANTGAAKKAVEAVYVTNKATIEKAETQEQMDALVKPCETWMENLGKHPRCTQ